MKGTNFRRVPQNPHVQVPCLLECLGYLEPEAAAAVGIGVGGVVLVAHVVEQVVDDGAEFQALAGFPRRTDISGERGVFVVVQRSPLSEIGVVFFAPVL